MYETELRKAKALETESWKDSESMDRLWPEVVAVLEDVLEQDPQNVIALTNLGAMYSNLGRYEEALGLLDKAEGMNFKDRNLFNNKGIVFVNLKREDEARKYFKTASKMEPHELTFEAYIDFHAL